MDESRLEEIEAMIRDSLGEVSPLPGADCYSELIEAESQLSTVRKATLGELRDLINKGLIKSSELEGLLLAEDAAKERWRFALARLREFENARHVPWTAAYGLDAFPSARNSHD